MGATEDPLSLCHLTMNMLILSRCLLCSSPLPAPSPEQISALLARPSPACCSADTVAVRLILDLALDLFDLPLPSLVFPTIPWTSPAPPRPHGAKRLLAPHSSSQDIPRHPSRGAKVR